MLVEDIIIIKFFIGIPTGNNTTALSKKIFWRNNEGIY